MRRNGREGIVGDFYPNGAIVSRRLFAVADSALTVKDGVLGRKR